MYTELDSTCVYMYMYEVIMSVAMCILNLTVHVYNYMYMYEVIMFVCAYRYHTLSVASSSALQTNTGKKIVVSKHHVQAYACSRHTSHC